MICVHEYPLSMVDHAGFRSFCASLQPMFKMVSRNTIKKDIIGLHETQKNAMIQYFAKFNHRVAVTSDLWTAGHQKKGYMVVTAHFINEEWELKSFLLRFMYVPCPHNAEVICEALHQVLVEWHLERKISTVTLDNCAANDKAIWNMEDKLDSDSLMLQAKLVHMRCCAHILNLIVQDGMSVLKDGIERVRDSIAYWSATPKRHERFEKMARTLNIPYTKKIGIDCKTRWNSTYVMLSIALPYQEIFYRLSRQVKQFDCCPTVEDWNFAKEVCDKLKIFYDITELLSGTKYVTANIFFPKICRIRFAIRKWSASNNELMQKMSEEMKEKFDKYWLDVHGLMAMATILDPRYKTHMLLALFRSLYGYEDAANKVDEIKKLMVELLLEYKVSDEPAASVQANVQVDEDQEDEVNILFDQYLMQQPISSKLCTELDLYLEEPTLPRTQEVDIITWWKVGGMKYPTLQRIDHDILPIPVTTVASESAFSTSGRILSAHRSRLAPKTAEALMCMQAWSRAHMLDNASSDQFAIQSVLEDEEEAMEDCESEITIED